MRREAPLGEEAADEVTNREEDQDYRGHDERDQTDHGQKARGVALLHFLLPTPGALTP